MFSYEDRLRAVQLYIKLGKRIGLTIRQPSGYQRRTRSGTGTASTRRAKTCAQAMRVSLRYSDADKRRAVDHYLDHGRCIAVTIMALGYPSRALFSAWLQELHPQDCVRVVSRSSELPAEAKQSAVIALCTRQSSAQTIADEVGVSWLAVQVEESTARPRRIRIDEAQSKTPLQAQIKQPGTPTEALRQDIRRLQLEKDLLKRRTNS